MQKKILDVVNVMIFIHICLIVVCIISLVLIILPGKACLTRLEKRAETKSASSTTNFATANPLEKAYQRLEPLMTKKEALDIMDKEYPIKIAAGNFSVECNSLTKQYEWRWVWQSNDEREQATLLIIFSREKDCEMCRIENAVYACKRDNVKKIISLLDNSKKL